MAADPFVKRLLYFLAALIAPFSRARSAKLGTEADPIRRMLFASQSLDEQLAQMHLNGVRIKGQVSAFNKFQTCIIEPGSALDRICQFVDC